MTEDEAKMKWCPFVSAWEGAGQSWTTRPLTGPDDRGQMTAEKAFCIGSDCMAWRAQRDVAVETTRSAQKPVGDGWLPGPGYDDWTRTRAVELGGYCGLAGRPTA